MKPHDERDRSVEKVMQCGGQDGDIDVLKIRKKYNFVIMRGSE